MGQQAWMLAARAVFMTTAVTLLVGCGGGGYGGTNPPTAYKVPAIANINNSTSPSITINVPNVPNPSRLTAVIFKAHLVRWSSPRVAL